MQIIRWRARIPNYLCSKIGISLFFGVWLTVGVLQVMLLDGQEEIFYVWRPWEDWMDTRMFRLPPNPNVTYAEIKDDTEYPDWDPGHLQKLLESPTTRCRHLTNLGGGISCKNCHTCQRDGNKYICFDEDVRPVPGDCLIYSFGVGGDTSWDQAMMKYNCNIYAFDMTTKWDNVVFNENFHFLNIGLYHQDVDANLNMSSDDLGFTSYEMRQVAFRRLVSIRDILGHKDRPIDVLKMDVEFAEWQVFEEIFGSPESAKVLDDVKQIALEIHLDDFKNSSMADRVAGGRRVEKVLQNLYDYGFHMVHTELNTAFQVHAEVRGQVVPLFRESLFIHRP